MGITSTTAPISTTVGANIKAIIWMGDPRHTPGASYNVGTSTADGVCILSTSKSLYSSLSACLLLISPSKIPSTPAQMTDGCTVRPPFHRPNMSYVRIQDPVLLRCQWSILLKRKWRFRASGIWSWVWTSGIGICQQPPCSVGNKFRLSILTSMHGVFQCCGRSTTGLLYDFEDKTIGF